MAQITRRYESPNEKLVRLERKVQELENRFVRLNHSHTVADVADVVITSPADNEVLAYDSGSGNWINQTAAEAGLSDSSHLHTGVYLPIGGTAVAASAWATGRTITLSGDVSGTSPAWTGSGNLAFSGTVVANDSHTHGTQYLPLTGGTLSGNLMGETVYPAADMTYDLGTSSRAFRSLYVGAIYDEDATLRIDTQGTFGTLFYNDSGTLTMDIGGAGTPFVRFQRKVFISSLIGNTGSTAYNSLVYNAADWEVYRFTSKRKLKKNIRDLSPALSEKLYDLRPRIFDMRKGQGTGDEWADKDQVGFIAEEVFDVFGPQGAPLGEDGEPSAWSDRFMTVLLVAEMQRMRERIDELEADLNGLRAP